MNIKGIDFCPDCSNMLYPIVVQDEKKLGYECRNCHYSKTVDALDPNSQCVYYRELAAEKATTYIDAELCVDKTFPRVKTKPCAKCGCETAVFFQNTGVGGDVEMSLVYICCGRMFDGSLCGASWIQGPKAKHVKS